MSIGALALADLDGLLKRTYMYGVKNQQNFTADMANLFPVAAEKPSGLDADGNAIFRFTVNLARRQAGGAQNANEQFRASAVGTKKQAGIIAKVNVWPIDITNFAIAASKGNTTEFASGLDFEMNDAETAFKKDRNRQFFGDGTGVLATISSGATNTTFTVDNTQYLFAGMRVDVYSSTTLQASNVLISSVDYRATSAQVVFAQSVTASTSAVLVRTGTKLNAPSDGKEIMGLAGISDDNTAFTTFQGLSRSTYPIWKGTVVDASSTAITQDKLQQTADVIEFISGRPINRIISHRVQRRAYLNLVTPLKRFNDDNLDSGFSTLSWNGHEWMISFDCQKTSVYMYDKNIVKRYVLQEMQLDNSDGKVLKALPGYDSVYCYYKSYENLGTEQPNAVGRLENLSTLTE